MRDASKRLLLLATKTGYQTQAFSEAAHGLGLDVVYATDRCHVLDDPWGDQALPLRFEDPEASAQEVVRFARSKPVAGIVALGDRPTPTAARACASLGLPFHPPEAADLCRDKYRLRSRLASAGLSVPRFQRFRREPEFQLILDRLPSPQLPFPFPWVLKPVALSGSRGVIRVDSPAEARNAFQRIRALLERAEIGALREETSQFLLVEEYVDGEEIAVEALMNRGQLQILAIFDKPDPLVGPYFEETIYITPSRLPRPLQIQVRVALERAAGALGLWHGPVHAEMRLRSPDAEPVILEVAARPIGGLCAKALRFQGEREAATIPLEELLVRLALGEPCLVEREPRASGVLMIPIPGQGIYVGAEGVEDAMATPGIEEVQITAKSGQTLEPLPEGSSYLGFIFARASSPAAVEEALRTAHGKLRFALRPVLPIL